MPQNADHIAAEAGTFEPQRQNNFTVEIPLGNDKEYISLSCQAIPLPVESNDEVEIQYQNEKRYVAGQATFDATSFTVRDYVDVDTRGAIMRWRHQVYNPATGAIGLASNYKKTVWIVMEGPDGATTRVCKLTGCWPQAVNGGTLDMSASDQVQIEVTLRFDKPIWSENIPGLTA